MDDLTGPEWQLHAFHDTIHRGGVGLWSWNPVQRTATLDALSLEFWGLRRGPTLSLDALFERIDPRDRDMTVQRWWDSQFDEGDYAFDFRTLGADGRCRWISARGAGGEAGLVHGNVLAVFVDVTAQREAQDALESVVEELARRMASLFRLASLMTRLASYDSESAASLAVELDTRFGELADVFAFAADDPTVALDELPLADVCRRLLRPWTEGGAGLSIDIEPDRRVSGRQIADLALLLHELASFSLARGALGRPAAHASVSVSVADGEPYRLVWRERGAAVTERASTRGPLALPLARRFDGRPLEDDLSWRFDQDGLVAEIALGR